MTDRFRQLFVLGNEKVISFSEEIGRGIEREGMRVDENGDLALTSHHKGLGAALTHPKITTDYSEALLELITSVHYNADDLLKELEDIHCFVYCNIEDEKIWAGSMPGKLNGDNTIPIAWFGKSNIGMMKHIYRKGLAERYSRRMQSIAGIHYNFSLSDKFWKLLQELQGNQNDLKTFKSESYFALIRNFYRYSWILFYLFGASPALSKTFLQKNNSDLQEFDSETLHRPFATSLRMSDLGYQSSAQSEISICYNHLDSYISSIKKAIKTEYNEYKEIGVKTDGEYRQLNTNLLQIENEFYSHIRPKRVTASGEKPVDALKERGVEYVEVRLLDINPLLPLGIDQTETRFLDTFLIFCLLEESPFFTADECKETKENQNKVIISGRDPKLKLSIKGIEKSLREEATILLEKMEKSACLLDQDNGILHRQALQAQIKKVNNPDLLPSQQILTEMKMEGKSYTEYILTKSKEHLTACKNKLTQEKYLEFELLAKKSLSKQKEIEIADRVSFDQFLTDYFNN